MDRTRPRLNVAGAVPPADAVCRGNWALGSACGTCDKCRREVAYLIEQNGRLRAELAALRKG